jgi:mannose-1-phosphate guanylyltransferase
MITPAIMPGGSGSRLWPLSRSLNSKQFLALNGHETMLQQTIQRLSGLTVERPVVICNEEHRFIVAEQLREINQSGAIILEPVGRNTAPVIALASKVIMDSKDSLILILAADHVIQNDAAFVDAVEKAIPLAEAGKLVTFGIVPTEAHTGYGYIKRGEAVDDGYKVDAFVEKPNADTAKEYFEGQEHYWNSGMFLMKASRYLEELNQFRPDIYNACESALVNTSKDEDFIRIDKVAFEKCPDESVDYAVMEKTKDAGWSGIGSWSALWDVNNKDADGNTVVGDSIIHETTNSLIQGNERLIATVGVDNLVIVDTKDALLVASKDKVQDVKKIVEQLKAEGRSEFKNHREVYRPWGKYDAIDTGTRYQVKRITVNPSEKLSIQMHHHRAEHWIVVTGTAKVTNGDKTFLVTENESTYIPIGVVHALENPGQLPLEIIEVQSGSYLGEDDIVRFEDRYGRV